MILELLTAPFVIMALLTAFVLAGIHTYLGFHVVSRGVIFVDLSLAQAAAFGSVVAISIGFKEHSAAGYFISLGFTFIAAWLIASARTKDNRVPQEAFIGIFYALFTAGVLLLLSHQATGAEVLNHLLAGSLLTVQPNELIKISVLYTIIGLIHWLLRERFLLISVDRSLAKAQGMKLGYWDFLFYAMFGMVVTSSVAVAGVMLVFALLVIPPVSALLLTSQPSLRIVYGWLFGFIGSLGGIIMAILFDLPVGASIITFLGVLLLSVVLFRKLK